MSTYLVCIPVTFHVAYNLLSPYSVRHHYLPDAVAIIGTMDLVFGEVDR
jgi:NADH:ubiquinone oxidoreductase subunit D